MVWAGMGPGFVLFPELAFALVLIAPGNIKFRQNPKDDCDPQECVVYLCMYREARAVIRVRP